MVTMPLVIPLRDFLRALAAFLTRGCCCCCFCCSGCSGFVAINVQSLLGLSGRLRFLDDMSRDRFFALAGAGIGLGALTAHRQTLAMAQAAVRPHFHVPAYVLVVLTAQIAFNDKTLLDDGGDPRDLLFGEVLGALVHADLCLRQNIFGTGRPDPVYIRKGGLDAFFFGKIYP